MPERVQRAPCETTRTLLTRMAVGDRLYRPEHALAHLVVALAVVLRAFREHRDVLAREPFPASERALA